MTWTCPNCGRGFRNKNQWHSCEIRELDHHLQRRSPAVREMVGRLLEAAHGFGAVEMVPVKTSIQCRLMDRD
ncbi:MAG: hypothetical protein O7D32_05185 [bacterium]|nr:hypothetical protein [bacterium]